MTKFIAFLVPIVSFVAVMFQLALFGLIGFMIYLIYTGGLKALIDNIWLGFKTVGGA